MRTDKRYAAAPLDAQTLAHEKAEFIAFTRAKGWPENYFVPHSGGRIEFGRTATQDRWEGWRDRASFVEVPADVFVPHAQCVAAGGGCLREGRCSAVSRAPVAVVTCIGQPNAGQHQQGEVA
ncbi:MULTISPECIES: hypothetical protein [Cupriavidus]